jgi:hypothetical protein
MSEKITFEQFKQQLITELNYILNKIYQGDDISEEVIEGINGCEDLDGILEELSNIDIDSESSFRIIFNTLVENQDY